MDKKIFGINFREGKDGRFLAELEIEGTVCTAEMFEKDGGFQMDIYGDEKCKKLLEKSLAKR